MHATSIHTHIDHGQAVLESEGLTNDGRRIRTKILVEQESLRHEAYLYVDDVPQCDGSLESYAAALSAAHLS